MNDSLPRRPPSPTLFAPSWWAKCSSPSGRRTDTSATLHGEAYEPTRTRARWSVSPERVQTTVDGKVLSLSNLDKVLYPKSGFTKSQVLDYYARIAEVMLPHLKNRPATFKRFPNGVDGMSFYEKHSPAGAPEWVHTISVPSKDGSHEPIDYTEVRDRP